MVIPDRGGQMHTEPHDIAIRFAAPADREDVARLAELDSAGRVDGEALVAVVGGRVRAALALEQGRVIADPFAPSAELASLLELRAQQLRAPADRRGPASSVARVLSHATLPASLIRSVFAARPRV
jgi:hypothetical protein